MFIVIAILAFGVLIFVHELGHFMAAKACGVKVTEFAMGMGPRLWKHQGRETVYSLRLLPIGGFCAMEGEDEASSDPRAFVNQAVWKRLIILAAGSFMNFLLGLVLVLALFWSAVGFSSPVIAGFQEGCPYEGLLQAGDEIWRVNGERVYFAANFSEYAPQGDEQGLVDLVLIRDGKKLRLEDCALTPVEYSLPDGTTEVKYGIYFAVEEATFLSRIRYSWYSCLDFVRMVRMGLVQLFSGQASMSDMSGVVGMVDIINETGQSAATAAEGLENVIYLVAFIAVNLAVMNMLPIPALDGGHILTLLITWVVERVFRRRVDPRIEGYIHYGGLILLVGLMVLVMFNDIVRIVAR